MKFSAKLNIVLLSIVLGLGLFLTSYVYQTGTAILKVHIYRQVQEEAFHVMDKLDRFLFERHADIQVMAGDIAEHYNALAANDINAQVITQRLISFRNQFKTYVSLTFYDKNRVSIADTSGINIGKTHSLTAYWPDIAAGKSYQGGHVVSSESLETPVIIFAEPVRDGQGKILGHAVSRIPLSKIYEITRNTARGRYAREARFIELIDRDGLIIYSSSDQQSILKKTAQQMGWFPDSVMFDEAGTALATINIAGRNQVFAYARQKGYLDFKGNDWTLIVHVPSEQVLAQLISMRNKMVITVFLVVFLAIAISLMFSRSITRPLRRLQETVRDIGNGKLGTRIDIASKDEIGDLSRAVNDMAKHLEEYSTSIDHLTADMSYRVAAERALQTEKDKLQQYLAVAGVMFVVLDKDGRVSLINKKTSETLGYASEELIGKNWFDMCVPESDRAETFGYFNSLMAGGSKVPAYYENPVLTKQGAQRHISWHTAVLFDEQRKPKGLVSSGEDITIRRITEKLMHDNLKFLQLLIASMPNPVYYKDTKGVYQECNKAFETILGRSRDSIIGKTAYDVAPKELADAYSLKDKELFDHPGVQTYEGKVANANGVSRDAIITKATYTDSEGKVAGLIGVMVDITDRKDMERTQRLAQLGMLVANIAHEVNNPLMIISGRVQLSQMENIQNEEIKNNFQIIFQECQRAKDIISRLRQFARPSKGESRLVQINASVDDVVNILEKQYGLDNIAIKRNYARDLPVLMIDEKLLQEVYMNILNNAHDAIEREGAIEVSTSREGDHIRIDFKDSGKGMPPEVLEKVFVPFFTTKEKGTGLGLPVCYSIVKAHNGQLNMESAPGKGTTVTILLPINQPSA